MPTAILRDHRETFQCARRRFQANVGGSGRGQAGVGRGRVVGTAR